MKSPEEIKKKLDEYVIGHEDAKKKLAVAAYNHFKRMKGHNIKKTNVIIIGPSGSGKTYMVSNLAKILNVGFLGVDATQFSAVGYKGKDTEDLIADLINVCENDEEKAAKSIIYIDEIDKIRKKQTSDSFDISGLGVQQSLLKLLEGSEIQYVSKNSPNGQYDKKLSTENIMFIVSGAFVGLPEVSTQALIEYGMIPEFLGRFSTKAELEKLTIEHYKKILVDSKGSIIHSYKEWFKTENINLIIDKTAIDYLAAMAIETNLGARGLHMALEEVLFLAQFEAPSLNPKPKSLIINSTGIKLKKLFWIY
jgi:ATP-dependent Clp protease ATP-binding subunit ClpX